MKPVITTDDKGRKVFTLQLDQLQVYALIFIIPLILLFGLPFYLVWGENAFTALRFRSFLFLTVFILGGVAVHELLHGITWALFAKKGFRSISFGIKWEYLTPYCHCSEPLKVWQFVAGALAPAVIMGFLPAVSALFTGNTLLMCFGIFYFWAASADILTVWLMRRLKKNQLVSDHPKELGFIVEEGKK